MGVRKERERERERDGERNRGKMQRQRQTQRQRRERAREGEKGPFARFTRADRILSLILSPISQHGLADVTLCSPLALHTRVSADGSSKAEGTAAAKRGVAAAKV